LNLISSKGATIDYKEDMMSSSFRIERNPQAQQTCSCGTSFSKKEE
jgi:Fe-S cluster assembly iron-binding protein IscA